jgi:UDP-glucose 4-epimerase
MIGEDPKGIPNNLLPYIQRVSLGQLPVLSVFGTDYPTEDGSCIRDFIHVVDLAFGHVICLENPDKLKGYHLYNLGTGKGTSVLELIEAYEKANNVEIKKVLTGRRAGDAAKTTACVDKVFEELGWKTKFTVEDACRDTGVWAKLNPNGFGK